MSAGNTGALMSAGLFIVGRIKGVARPALVVTLPTIDGKGFVFLDVVPMQMRNLNIYCNMHNLVYLC